MLPLSEWNRSRILKGLIMTAGWTRVRRKSIFCLHSFNQADGRARKRYQQVCPAHSALTCECWCERQFYRSSVFIKLWHASSGWQGEHQASPDNTGTASRKLWISFRRHKRSWVVTVNDHTRDRRCRHCPDGKCSRRPWLHLLGAPYSGHVCCFCYGIKFISAAHCLDGGWWLRPDFCKFASCSCKTSPERAAPAAMVKKTIRNRYSLSCLHNSRSTATASRQQDVSGRSRSVFTAADR